MGRAMVEVIGQLIYCDFLIFFGYKTGDLTWYITIVYADCNRVTGRELWSELAVTRSRCEGPWVVYGDFNVTTFVAERVNV